MPSIKNILIGGYLLKVIITFLALTAEFIITYSVTHPAILANYEAIFNFHNSLECGGLILCRLQDSNVQVLWVRF